MSMDGRTIVAIATPPGRGGVGIVRVSGPLALDVIRRLTALVKPDPLVARHAYFSPLMDLSGATVDEALVLFFPGPNSFTGEDIVEFHCHGGPVILNQVVESVVECGAVRAQPGEFSQRAFLNGKIDLTQAEAIADLIDSTSKSAARSAIHSLQGQFSKKIDALLSHLIYLRTFVEAGIDFSDEEIDLLNDVQLKSRISELENELAHLLSQAEQGVILRDGLRLALIGKPNAGKSSLLNALAGDDVAIVTDVAGTTRDVLREFIHIDGIPVHISDTAGLRESSDAIEEEGVKRACREFNNANKVLLVVDVHEYLEIKEKLFPDPPTIDHFWPQMPGRVIERPKADDCILIINKIDLVDQPVEGGVVEGVVTLEVSAKERLGMDLITEALKQQIGYQAIDGTFSARSRHVDVLKRVSEYINLSKEQLYQCQAPELFAEDLRLAQQALGEITGVFRPDDLLGKIFSTFCIGK